MPYAGHGEHALCLPLDAPHAVEATAAVEQAVQRFGRINVPHGAALGAAAHFSTSRAISFRHVHMRYVEDTSILVWTLTELLPSRGQESKAFAVQSPGLALARLNKGP